MTILVFRFICPVGPFPDDAKLKSQVPFSLNEILIFNRLESYFAHSVRIPAPADIFQPDIVKSFALEEPGCSSLIPVR